MGAVVDRCDLKESGDASELVSLKRYLDLSTTFDADDKMLNQMILASKVVADKYLSNPFESIVPVVVFSDNIAVDDQIIVNGLTYTAAAATDADEREFDATDGETAASAFASLINSDIIGGTYIIGLEHVKASVSALEVTLSRREPYTGDIDVSVTVDTTDAVKEQTTRVEDDIPEPVRTWCFLYVKRHWVNRDGHLHQSEDELGSTLWSSGKDGDNALGEDYSLIKKFRRVVGI